MFESIITSGENLSIMNAVICMGVSLILGIVIAIVHMMTTKYNKNFVITVATLPILVQVIILMVNGNLGTSVAVLGAFSLVRFRSVPGNSREIIAIFFAMATGLAVGMGQIMFSIVFTVVVSLILLILSKTKFGNKKCDNKKLKIIIPESLDYTDVFDTILEKYTKEYNLEKVKTTNMGSMFELTYNIFLNSNMNEKKFMDEIRERNGNLTVSIYIGKENENEL